MTVVEDYSVKLNQTNIGGGANNNKFYIIQVLESGGKYFAWTRWGRVGDEGQNKLQPCANQAKAVQEFEKKFREKTGNNYSSDRSSFVKKTGKYGLVETEDSAGGGEGEAPMGKLTEVQIQKGQAVLDRLRPAVGRSNTSQIDELSSQFYSLIPHNFGWKKPPAINTMDLVDKEAELLKFFLRMGFEKVDSDKTLSPISGVMSLRCPPSLEDAAKGICASSAVSASNKQGKELAARQAGAPTKTMDAHLYAAIMLYTSNAIYVALNKCLRDSDRVKVKKYFKYLRLFFEAMDRLPKQKRTLWRGISVDLYDNAEYSVGNTVTWWGVSSCTSDQKVAQGFAKGCGGNCTLVTVQSTSACDISAISFFGNEKESLLRPGTQLKVKSKAKKGNVTEITLQEVGCAIE
jgi:predicted DNA-binding WGR domain protein